MNGGWWGPYVGLPFGTEPGAVTCWSLVRRVYLARAGIDLPAYGDIDARDLVDVASAFRRGDAREVWAEAREPQALDLVAMRSARGGRAVCHVGVMVSDQLMLHAEEASGSCVVPVSHWSVRARIAGYRRYAIAA